MTDIETISKAKRDARQRLFAIPGVHSVAVGPKKTRGKPTGENAILVYVVQKKSLDALHPAEVIPAEIDGVKVDVIESPMATLLVDEADHEPLTGGIQIQSGGDHRGEGTLGFIAQSTDGQKIYAVTNQHVLIPTGQTTTNLDAKVDPAGFGTSVTVTFDGPTFGSIYTNTTVGIRVHGIPASQGSLQRFAVVFSTPDGANQNDVAIAIRDELNATGLVAATQTGPAVTVTPGATLLKILVEVKIFGRKITEGAGLDADVIGNVITFSGQAVDPGGVFVNFNIGGPHPSFGVFVPIDSGDDASAVATNTLAALDKLKNSARLQSVLTGLNLQRTDAKVTLGGAEEVDCGITKDDRVGQATNCFCCRHHKCCSNRIGRVVAAALDLDLGVVQLDGELKYVAKVEGIPENGGAVFGTTDAKMNDSVQKRGRTSELTSGTVSAINADGLIGASANDFSDKSFFHRYYQNAIRIDASSGDFSQAGDSGSAVMDTHNNIVGLLFGGGKGAGHGLATPIASVIDALKELDAVVATTTDASAEKTVPGPSFNFTALPAGQMAAPIAGGAPLMQGLHRAEAEIEAIPAGKELSDAVRRHASECFRLVTSNRRVGAVWKRNGGQQIFPALLGALHNPAARLPEQIGGKPLAECLGNIRSSFERYGSPAFVADLRRWGGALIELASLSYREMLVALEGMHRSS
jgi:hypothetical protein